MIVSYRISLAILGTAFLLAASGTVQATLQNIKPGVFYEDFKGTPADVFEASGLRPSGKETSEPAVLELVKDDGEPALHLKGKFHTCVFYQDKPLKNFVLETTFKKGGGSYGGIVVRDHWRVYFQMKCFLSLNTDLAGMGGGEILKSGSTFPGYHKLKVVCAGPMLHAYVDGEHIFSYEIPDTPGRVGFYSHGNGDVHVRDIRINTHVEPAAYMALTPTAPDNALVFPPDNEVELGFEVKNNSQDKQSVTVVATVKDWEGNALGSEVSRTVEAPCGVTPITLPLGRLPEGFHCVVFQGILDGKAFVQTDDLPLAVQERGDGKFSLPVIPVAAYSKYYNKKVPIYVRTYTHAIAKALKDHHFNAIVADPSFSEEGIGIYKSYGIATIARSGAFLDQPSVIATLASDEPKPDEIDVLRQSYDDIRKRSGKRVTTCLVGEGTGLGSDHDPVNIWRKLDAKPRAFRWYGIKKSFYNILYDTKYKGILPLASVMQIAELSADTDWWFVPPSFGRTDHEGYYKNPTPAEMRGLMNLAMAHGADGLMLWCLQTHSKWPALIGQKSLQPPDGKFEAAGEVAATIAKHADLLASLRYGGFEIRNSNPIYIEAVPRKTDEGQTYIYALNKDAQNASKATLAFKGQGTAKDLFTGQDYQTTPKPDGFHTLTLEFGPCEAVLLSVSVALPVTAPVKPLSGDAQPTATLVDGVKALIDKHGITVLSAPLSETLCIPGDAIGLSRADDPRNVWKASQANLHCLSWSGLLNERTAEGYLPLRSALRLADAYESETPFWTLYPALGRTQKPSAPELRAMLHLSLAYGSKAVVIPDAVPAALKAVVAEVERTVTPHGKTIADLAHVGLDIRCKNAMVAAIGRKAADSGNNFCYVVNMDTENTVNARLLLWDQVWDWSKARDLFTAKDFEITTDKEGYLGITIPLAPGDAALIETDAVVAKK